MPTIDFELLGALNEAREQKPDSYLIDLAIEEMAELVVAINHYRRDRADISDVRQEIADVILAMKELEVIYGNTEVTAHYLAKRQRFIERVKNKQL